MISLILARANDGIIGRDGTLPWRLPEDMHRFKTLTMGKPCVMGRKTWDGLPEKFRPLPGRANIVVTRDAEFSAAGASVVHSLEEALARANTGGEEVMVIGGAEMYTAALPFAERVYLTEIHARYRGDAVAPIFVPGQWVETERQDCVSASGLSYSFVTLERAH